jgi:hypothetical protein
MSIARRWGRCQSPIVRIGLRAAVESTPRPQSMTRGRERASGADASLRFLPEPKSASQETGYEDNHDYKGHLDIINHT